MPELKIIRNYTERENSHTLESYVSSGGYKALDKALHPPIRSHHTQEAALARQLKARLVSP